MAASLVISAALSKLKEFSAEGGAIAVAYEGRLTARVKNLVQKLEDILPYMPDAERRRLDEEPPHEISQFMVEIRCVCYKAEDVLDDLALKIASSRTSRRRSFKGVAGRCMPSSMSIIIHGTDHGEAVDAQRLEEVEAQIHTLKEKLPSLGLTQTEDDLDTFHAFLGRMFFDSLTGRSSQASTPIGIDREVTDIVNLLVHGERGQSQQVIFLVGARGSGKTTLAKRVLEKIDSSHRGSFEASAWVTVSDMYGTISVFKSVLEQLGEEITKNQFEDDTKIAEKLFQVLQSKKCLIVLDDLVSSQVWKTLRFAFTYQKANSKVLVTTRNIPSDLQLLIQEQGWLIREMKPLTPERSWALFKSIAFGHWLIDDKNEEDHKKEEIGKKIARVFRRQPQVVKMAAELLASKNSSEWERVYERINSYQEFEISSTTMTILNESYNALPYYLKPCFSYLGTFPENSDIEAEKLFQLWMAEDISTFQLWMDEGISKIQLPIDELELSSEESEENLFEKEGNLIDVGNWCLHDLSSRRMVDVQDVAEDVPTINLRNVTHQFCSSKLQESGFLEVMDLRHYSGIPTTHQTANFPSSTRKMRRLAVYLDQFENGYPTEGQEKMLRTLETADSLRTLLFINVNRHQQCILWPEQTLNLGNIRILRILGFDGCSFQTRPLPKGIEKLVLLKYLSLSGCYLQELPSYIGNLLYLQTLDLQVTASCKMIIPDDILCKLKSLMHLYLPVAFQAKGVDKLRFAGLNKLQILKNFDTRVCHAQHLLELSNIQVLDVTTSGSDEDLKVMIQLINTSSRSMREVTLDVRNFDCYSSKRRDIITELFKCRDPLLTLRIDGRIGELPLMNFSGIIKLTFHGTEFVLDPMGKLGDLPNLCVLVLSDVAFVGKDMVCSRRSFPELKRLQLSGLHNLEKLTIEEEAMPQLTTLAIERCKRLEVSQRLRDLYQRRVLHTAGMPIEFENGLRQVEQRSETSESSATMATRDDAVS